LSEIPTDLRYSEDHLWVSADASNGRARVRITDLAQDSLEDVVGVTLPELGQTLTAAQACGEIESTKSVSDLISPPRRGSPRAHLVDAEWLRRRRRRSARAELRTGRCWSRSATEAFAERARARAVDHGGRQAASVGSNLTVG
jgi:hypothetical protein